MPAVKFSASMSGAPLAIKRFDFAEDSVKLMMSSTLAQMGSGIVRTMGEEYPAKPTHSGYRDKRTHAARLGWYSFSSLHGPPIWQVTIDNQVKYAPWLYHRGFQVDWARERGWPTIQAVTKIFINRADEIFEQVARELIEIIKTGERAHLSAPLKEGGFGDAATEGDVGLGDMAPRTPFG